MLEVPSPQTAWIISANMKTAVSILRSDKEGIKRRVCWKVIGEVDKARDV